MWIVPITITTASGTVKKVVLKDRTLSVTLSAEDKDWVKVRHDTIICANVYAYMCIGLCVCTCACE